MQHNKATLAQQGVNVLMGLAALSWIEFLVGVNRGSPFLLTVVAVIKVIVIATYFMHMGKLFKDEEGAAE
ncbi:MAG: hypothetical protein HY782_24865 [Chloroflexi bacterium]|nr:hypothetical protein [Chloroflexota bacterium]